LARAQKKEEGETMTMRRVSVLLVAVVMAMMLSMGSAWAHQSDNHKVCFKGDTISGFTHKQQQRFLDRHPKADPGKCDNNRGGGVNIGKVTSKKATAPWR
jgi:hypothetical protein